MASVQSDEKIIAQIEKIEKEYFHQPAELKSEQNELIDEFRGIYKIVHNKSII